MKPANRGREGIDRRSLIGTLGATVAVALTTVSRVSSADESRRLVSTIDSNEARNAALDELVPKALRRSKIPGALLGVWQRGHQPYLRAFGVANTATREPMRVDSHMRIGSLTKTFVVQAILQLVKSGKVALDDPIGNYVRGVPQGNVITLRQLAAMRSGLYNYAAEVTPKLYMHPNRQWTPRELLEIAFSKPLVFRPGTEFDYSNTNTVLLGLVVEKASGIPLRRFIRQRITEPLGLSHTLMPTGASIPSPHPTAYTNWTPGARVVACTNWNPSWGWAAGDMISNLKDVGTWTRALFQGRLITPELQRERERFLPAEAEGHLAKYGLALERHSSGWVGHNGNLPGFMTYPYYLPSRRITVVLLINSNSNTPGSWSMLGSIIRVVAPDDPWSLPPRK